MSCVSPCPCVLQQGKAGRSRACLLSSAGLWREPQSARAHLPARPLLSLPLPLPSTKTCSRFNPGFYNSGGSKPGQIAYGSNIKRTACMAATKDGARREGPDRPGWVARRRAMTKARLPPQLSTGRRARPPPRSSPSPSPADWCSACDGATCTACYERPQYGQASGRNKIELEPASKKVS